MIRLSVSAILKGRIIADTMQISVIEAQLRLGGIADCKENKSRAIFDPALSFFHNSFGITF